MVEKRSTGIRQRRAVAVAVVITVWLASMIGLGQAAGVTQRGDGFSIVHWEVTRLTGFALNRSAGLIVRRTATDDQITGYFDLLGQARAAHQGLLQQPAGQDLQMKQRAYDALLAQAEVLRVPVQSRYEQALEATVRRTGLVEQLPLYSATTLVWPPVATGFSVPPHILITSPRSRIELLDTRLLRTDLSDADAARIEHDAENRNVSTLVEQIGGLGAFPSIADRDDSPLGLMQTVAHEWMHEYLVFRPLGARYAASNDMTFINETVAELVGRELGSLAFDSLGLPRSAPARPAPPEPATTRRVDFNRTMHDLRLQVDQLLKDGRIDEAEQRMNVTQRLLADNGYNIRKINQAYLAFYGSYGTNAAASNPLAVKIDAVRRESPSLESFVRTVEEVSKPSDLDRILQRSSR
jgi:hypothetical protein